MLDVILFISAIWLIACATMMLIHKVSSAEKSAGTLWIDKSEDPPAIFFEMGVSMRELEHSHSITVRVRTHE